MRISDCFTEGKIGLIDGTMGSGKTDLACTLMENLIQKKRFQIITNIIFLKKEENIMSCSKASKLLLYLADAENNTVVFLDEAGLWAHSKEAMKKKSIDLERLVMIVRKFRSNFIFIAQNYGTFLPIIRSFCRVRMSKDSKKTMILEICEDGKKIKESVKGVWRTNLSFDTYSIPFFSFDIDLEKLFDAIADIPSNQIKEKIKVEIKNLMDEKINEKRTTKTDMIKQLKSEGHSGNEMLREVFSNWDHVKI